MNDEDDNQRTLPKPIPQHLIANEWRNGYTKQERVPRPPTRAIKLTADALRNAMRGGNPLDYADIHERFVDLWMEVRLCLWRCKHKAAGFKTTDPVSGKNVLTYTANEKLVLQAIDCARSVLDSMVRLRREADHEERGIPNWAVDKIELALRDHPAALAQLIKALTEDDETKLN